MPASASLSVSRIQVVPGSRATALLTVRNTGSVVDEFRLEVIGAAARWTTVRPDVVPLFPGAEATVEVEFAPPLSSSISTGEVDVGVKINSKEDPNGSAVEELVVVLGAFTDSYAELVPRTIRGGRSATAELALDNRGNARLDASAAGLEPDGALRFEIEPPGFTVQPGAANFAKVRVLPVKRFLRGPDRTIPFKVVTQTGTGGALSADGMFVQRALVPRWLARLLLSLLVALIALALIWQFAFKPVLRSAASAAAKKDVQAAADKAAKQTAAAVTGSGSGGSGAGAGGGAAGGGAAGGGAAGGGASGNGGDDGRGGTSADKRIAVDAGPGETKSGSWTPAGDGKQFDLTDIVMQNPKGDTGLLRIKRGNDILLESALENFRDLDFHFVAPYVFKGADIVVEVECKNAATAGPCQAAATLTGFIR